MNSILRMERWFLLECDGSWEHAHGVEIGTLDNPGWKLVIDLEGTELEGKKFEKIRIERSEHNWVHYKLESGRFKAYGGPENLEEMINVFVDWAEGK